MCLCDSKNTLCTNTDTQRKQGKERVRGGERERERERRTSEKNYKELDELNASEECLAAAAMPPHGAEFSILPETRSFYKDLTTFQSR